jgi:mono/diheme cytochrome c family protein
MMNIPPLHNTIGHTWHHSDRQLTDMVLNGSAEMGEMMRRMMGSEDTPRMPAFKDTLTEEEVGAILAYIKTWWTEEQREWQAQVTRAQR